MRRSSLFRLVFSSVLLFAANVLVTALLWLFVGLECKAEIHGALGICKLRAKKSSQISQSINQSLSQPINQLINQFINHSIKKSIWEFWSLSESESIHHVLWLNTNFLMVCKPHWGLKQIQSNSALRTPVNTDSSLFRTVLLVPGKRKPSHFI